MFIEINKINSYGEQGKAFVRVDDIQGIIEKHVPSTKLYDENGDLVSETPATTKDFQVLVVTPRGNDTTLHIDENEYNRLVQVLSAK